MKRVYNLIDFLPHEKNTILNSVNEKVRILKLFLFFLKHIKTTIIAIKLKKYHYFDAQISENLCQIRAFYIRETFNNLTSIYLQVFSAIEASIFELKKLIDYYSYYISNRPSHYHKAVNQKISLCAFSGSFINKINLDKELFIFVQLHLLSKYKLVSKYSISPGIDYVKLSTDIEIESKTFLRKLIHKLQRTLSNYSSLYVRNFVRNSECFYLMRIMQEKDEVGRSILPCYEVTKILLNRAKSRKYFLELQIIDNEAFNTHCLHFQYSEKANKFIFQENLKIENSPVISIKGYTHHSKIDQTFFNNFLSYSFEDILLANMAQHTQYSGKKLSNLKYNPYQYLYSKNNSCKLSNKFIELSEKQFLYHKALSEKIGCSQNNASLFLITHIFCNSVYRVKIEEKNTIFT